MTNFPTSPIWQWQEWQGLTYLTCCLLEDWPHGFFTQDFYPEVPETLVEVLQPHAAVFRVKQVHGDRFLRPTEIQQSQSLEEKEETLPSADAVISEQGNQSVWVASADCTPVLVGDRVTGQVAAIHAGWRGTAQSIVPKVVKGFLASGSELPNLRLALGPAIAGTVYQVDRAVGAEVGASLFLDVPKTATEILDCLANLAEPPILPDPEPEKIRLDVRRINALQLAQLGLQPYQVAIAPYCTYQMPERFFSYRRSQEKKVQWSGIVSWSSKYR